MANSVDLVIGSEAIKQVENLVAKLSLADAELLKISQTAASASKGISSISTPTGLDKTVQSTTSLNSELSKQNAIIAQLQGQIQKLTIAKQQATTQYNSLGNSINSVNKATRESSVANQIARAETDRNFRATTLLAGAYARASAQLLILKKQAKDAAIAYGENSKQAITAAKAASDLDFRIKSADKSVGDYQRNVGNYTGGVVGGFKSIFSGVRQFAYILPGLGIAGIFNIAFEAIRALIEKMDLFKSKANQMKQSNDTLNKSFEESSVKDATKNVEELTINIGLAKQGFLNKQKVVDQYNETIGKTTGLVGSLDEAERELTKNGDAYIKMTLYKAAANLALEDAAKQSLEAEKSRLKSLKEFQSSFEETNISSGGAGGLGTGAFNASEFEADKKRRIEAQKKRKNDEIKISEDAAQQSINIAKKFQEDAAKIAKDFDFNLFGDTKKPKDTSKADNKEQEGRLKAIYDANKKELEYRISLNDDILKANYSTYEEQYKALQQSYSLKLMLAKLNENELIRLAKGNNDKIKAANFDFQKEILKDTQDFNKQKSEIAKKENEERIQEIKNIEKFLEDYHKDKDSKEEISQEIENKALKSSFDNIDKKIEKLKELKKATDNYLQSFSGEFMNKSGFGETFDTFFKQIEGSDGKMTTMFQNLLKGADGAKEKFAVTFNAIAESAQEAFNFISNASQGRFDAEKERLQSQYEFALKGAGDNKAAQEKLAEDLEKKKKEIANRENKAKQKQAIFNIAIDTAQAVIATLAKTPPPAGLPLAFVMGALGAAQIALVASQKIPQYFDGTDNHIGGMMLVNDGAGANFQEKVVLPNGKEIMPEGRNVLMNAPKGTKVLTHEQQIMEMLNERGISMTRNYQTNGGMTANEMDYVMGKHFAKIQVSQTTYDRNGFSSWIGANGNKTIQNNNRVSGTGFKV